MKTALKRLLLPSLSIRKLVALWVVCIVIAWAALVGGWFVVHERLAVLNERVVMDANALDAARELETEILAHHREDLLWQATHQAYHRELGETHIQRAQRIAAGLDPYATSSRETNALAEIRARLNALQTPSESLGTAETEAKSVYGLLGAVDTFQDENARQMEESLHASNHLQRVISRSAIGLSGCTAVLLFAGAVGILKRIVSPVLALRRTAAAFGHGDFEARVPILHDDELGTLAATFNNMAMDIAQREKERLRFVAMVVHDLKNPAYALETATRQLRDHALDPERRQIFLDAMIEEAGRLRLIVRDLTDDIQVASGQFTVQKQNVDLSALVRDLVQRRAVTATDHQIHAETDGACPIAVDPARIERVLTNLLSNAVKYSPPRTPITVRVERQRTTVTLSVTDRGVGIEKEDLKMLFQPFGRGRSANTLAEGAGMGLYVVKQIVEAHGGQVTVESQPGRGTTFSVTLPLTEKPPAAVAV